MMMEVKIISKESIQPSSPTPHHLRTFKLCLLDQLIPAPYAPMVLFYPNDGNGCSQEVVERRLALLKQSLSETLTRFYPLAGKIKDDLSIDCDNEGAYFVEAEVSCGLFGFLEKPDLHLVQQLLPCEPCLEGSTVGTSVANVQVSIFGCGGIAIGLCVSHKVVDGAALSAFLKAWAAMACGSEDVQYPSFIAGSLFPTGDLWLRDSSIAMWGAMFRTGKGATRRLIFDASAIATLKAKATSSKVQSPTRVEVVSALIWKCAMSACQEELGRKRRPLLMTHVVNLRTRATPALPECSLGNLIWLASAECMAQEEARMEGLVSQVREAISRINDDFVEKIEGDERLAMMSKSIDRIRGKGTRGGVDYFGFTSWCKLGFYEADFGWGKPVWVSGVGAGGAVFMNLIILMDTRYGDGIEAWVTLDEQEMKILESDMEVQARIWKPLRAAFFLMLRP